MEERKKEEINYHNLIRGESVINDSQKQRYYYSNMKYYSAARRTYAYQKEWLFSRCRGKKILVLGCGNGAESFFISENGGLLTGIDISDVAIKNARNTAIAKGLDKSISFEVMDAENLKFKNNSFDIITASGMLHHTSFEKVISESARVLKIGGEMFCIEPLAYNPIFQLYRRITPHLRTKWEAEHILTKREISISKKYFQKIDLKFFHLITLLAVPFRNTFLFNPFLGFLEKLDSIVLRLPGVKWLSWQIVLVLSKPKK